MTSRELVKATLHFENKTGRVPRQMWSLPWAQERAGSMVKKINQDFPADIYNKLWADGGCIAQYEFGPGGNPDNVYTVFKAWNEIR